MVEIEVSKSTFDMDGVTGFVFWPVVTVFTYSRFLVSCVCATPYVLWKILIKRKSPLASYSRFYQELKSVPLGKYLFSGLIGFYAPYQMSVMPCVEELTESGFCSITMPDLPWVRNPFSSVHAAALTNLGEACGGIAVLTAFQKYKHLRG